MRVLQMGVEDKEKPWPLLIARACKKDLTNPLSVPIISTIIYIYGY